MMSYHSLLQGLVLSGFVAVGAASADTANRSTFSPARSAVAASGTEDHVVVGKRLQAIPSGSINDPIIGPNGTFRNGVMADLPTYG